MKDKIIQITDTLNDEADGQTFGLSKSGKLYVLVYKKVIISPETTTNNEKFEFIPSHWKLLIDSPELIK
jgi:hypothetical protein